MDANITKVIESGLRKTNLSLQTRVGKLKLVCVEDTTLNNSCQTCWQTIGENRDKFYLSPTVCQHVCRLFLCRLQTPT